MDLIRIDTSVEWRVWKSLDLKPIKSRLLDARKIFRAPEIVQVPCIECSFLSNALTEFGQLEALMFRTLGMSASVHRMGLWALGLFPNALPWSLVTIYEEFSDTRKFSRVPESLLTLCGLIWVIVANSVYWAGWLLSLQHY